MFNDFVFNMDRLIANDPDPVDVVLKSDDKQRTSQWSLPLGNLIVTGGYGDTGGMSIWLRQNAPDTTQPVVSYHIPKRNQSNYPEWAPLSFIIHETLDNTRLDPTSHFTVRPVTGANTFGPPVEGLLAFGSNNLLTFTPHQKLASNQIYQVDFYSDPANNLGFRDAAGNYIEAYSFKFSTGALPGANEKPSITSFTVNEDRVAPNTSINFTFTATDPENDALEYRVNTGDGSGFEDNWTSFSGSGTFNHTYTTTGRFTAKVQVRDTENNRVVSSQRLIVISSPSGTAATHSSTIIQASDGRIWVVNPDSNTVSVIDPGASNAVTEYPVGDNPRNLAEDNQGRIWVTCRDSDEVYVLNGSTGAAQTVLALDYGASPHGVAASPAGDFMYVTHYGTGDLIRYQTSDFSYIGENLGPTPYAIAINGSHGKVYVTRFISPAQHGEVYRLDVSNSSLNQRGSIKVSYDEGPDGGDLAAGVPNYLAGITISPDGQYALVPSKLDNNFRGLAFGEPDLTFENTVRAVVSVLDLGNNKDRVDARRDFDNSDSPTAVAFSPDGDVMMTTLQGNNQIGGVDALAIGANVTLSPVALRATTGLAPQGMVVDAANKKVYSQDFMGRSVTVFDATDMFTGIDFRLTFEETVDTVNNELLSSQVLLGKQIFYDASDTRMAADSYISCATCHVDGGSDNRVWDFTGRGEGLRRTPSLRGRGGMDHGNVHWSGNFDEIQDFEHDMRGPFGGTGFLSEADFAATSDTLGAPKAGLSPELDALAAYVTSLGVASLPRSPHRNTDGTFSVDQAAAESILTANNCMSCHSGTNFTASAVGAGNLENVGTVAGKISGGRLGGGAGSLTGIDTPTLLGLYENDLFLHHGLAESVEEVFTFTGGKYYEAEEGIKIYSVRENRVENRGGLFDNMDDYYRNVFGSEVMRILPDPEDLDNDSNLDVDEDTIVENNKLDPGEDVDGDGRLDVDEDVNENGMLDIHDTGIEFINVDGGSGGSSFIRLRSAVGNDTTTVFVEVNGGTPVALNLPEKTGRGWTEWDIPGVWVNMSSGTSNTVRVYSNNQEQWYLDGIIVGTSDDITSAQAHTSITGSDVAILSSYLKQLDGRDADGNLPPISNTGQLTYGNGGQPGTGQPWAISDSGVTRVEAEFYDQGGEGVAHHDDGSRNGDTSFRPADNVDVQGANDTGGGYNIGWIGNDEWVEYSIDVQTAGTYDLTLRAASSNDNPGDAKFVIDGTPLANDGTVLGTIDVIGTGGWQSYQTFSLSGITLAAGPQILRIEMVGGSFNINWMELDMSGGGATVLAANDTGNNVNEGSNATIDVLDNDTGNGLSVEGVTQGSLGSVTITSGGADVTYTPNLGVWSGTDSFTYTATDGLTNDTATVDITINTTEGTGVIPTTGSSSLPVALESGGVTGDSRVLDSNGHWQITSDAIGFDTSGGNDSLYMLADDTVSGNFDAYVQLVSLSGPSGSRMGLMLRDGTGAGAEFIAIGSDAGDGYTFQQRTGTSGADAETNASQGSSHSFASGKWVSLKREGDTVTVAVDDDNNTYTQETIVDISGWSDTLHVGLFVHSGAAGTNAVAEFDGYTIVPITGGGSLTNTLDREYWTGIGGTGISSLTGNASYPNSPTGSDTLDRLESVDWNNSSVTKNWAESYGQRIRGYIVPEISGSYSFWIAGDDSCELWLSTDSDPANASKIAYINGWSPQYSFTQLGGGSSGQQQSAPVTLVAGQAYYVEVVHKEGGGGDNVSVAWSTNSTITPTQADIVPGSVLSAYSAGVPNAPTEIASDGFESNSWSGGTGWATSAWTTSANGGSKLPEIRTSDNGSIFPYEGGYFGRVRDVAYASRSVDLAGKTNASASFVWSVLGLDASGEKVVFEVNDGTGWSEAASLPQGTTNYVWQPETVDLSPYSMVDGFQVRFRVIGSDGNDGCYFDSVSISATGN